MFFGEFGANTDRNPDTADFQVCNSYKKVMCCLVIADSQAIIAASNSREFLWHLQSRLACTAYPQTSTGEAWELVHCQIE